MYVCENVAVSLSTLIGLALGSAYDNASPRLIHNWRDQRLWQNPRLQQPIIKNITSLRDNKFDRRCWRIQEIWLKIEMYYRA